MFFHFKFYLNSIFFEPSKLSLPSAEFSGVCLFSPMNAIMSDPRHPIRLELSDKITFIE